MRFLLASYLLAAFCAPASADRLVLVAGGDGPDGTEATKARLIQPFAVDFGPRGEIYLVEMAKGERLRAITTDGKLVTLAGKEGVAGNEGDGGPGLDARFNGMHSLAVGGDGKVYLADTWNNRVRLYDPETRKVTAFAGTGQKGYAGDGGPARTARFGGCYCLALDPAGKSIVITDLDNRRIRTVDLAAGTAATVAGNGKGGTPRDGEAALSQPLVDPRAAAMDQDGRLYILERGGHALRMVDAEGKIHTVAGTGKKGMGTGKGLEAGMNGPKHLCIDRDGSVLIADTENHRIVRYSPKEGTLTLVAGTGKAGAAGLGGDPVRAELSQPHGVSVHPKTGEIYIADSTNNRILKIVRE
jgi:DNA-binding beta-propeller fold protein YncE